MTKRKKFRPARFLPGRGVPWHGGMKPLPQSTKRKKELFGATNAEQLKGGTEFDQPCSASNDTRETEENQA